MKNTIQVDNEVVKLVLSVDSGGNRVAEPTPCYNFKLWAKEFGIDNYVVSHDEERDRLNHNRLSFRYFITFQTEQEAVLFTMTWGDFRAKLDA